MVPNAIDINWHFNERSRIRAQVPSIPNQNLVYKSSIVPSQSLDLIGPRLWNITPASATCTVSPTLESFKANLQGFLDTIPDLPPVGNYVSKNNNSLLDWAMDGGRHC